MLEFAGTFRFIHTDAISLTHVVLIILLCHFQLHSQCPEVTPEGLDGRVEVEPVPDVDVGVVVK